MWVQSESFPWEMAPAFDDPYVSIYFWAAPCNDFEKYQPLLVVVDSSDTAQKMASVVRQYGTRRIQKLKVLESFCLSEHCSKCCAAVGTNQRY